MKRTKPNCVDFTLTKILRDKFLPDVLNRMDDVSFVSGYSVFVVRQKRGVCSYRNLWITVPSWAWSRGDEYIIYYLAHELAHAHNYYNNKRDDNHGRNFMKSFIQLCPTEYQHYEYSYKPRNAKNAGVAQQQ